jgi:hypothetical protein
LSNRKAGRHAIESGPTELRSVPQYAGLVRRSGTPAAVPARRPQFLRAGRCSGALAIASGIASQQYPTENLVPPTIAELEPSLAVESRHFAHGRRIRYHRSLAQGRAKLHRSRNAAVDL